MSLDDEIRNSAYPRLIGTAFLDRCSPKIRRFWEYWDSRRGGKPMPGRHDIDPLDIPSDLLPGILLTEVLRQPPWLRYRLVGTAQVALRGRDPTGQPVQGNYMGSHLGVAGDDVMLNYRIVIEKRTPVYTYNPVVGALPDGSSLRASSLRANSSLLMPLSPDGETVDMVFCFSDLEDP
ncbi:MAG: PAS domain-containing protein [Ferrovibrio sp.]|uniref:PAS domain-containing protein n=1 Tax=Ferrovibrio sp. TaxID=1917215 RepID=UPI002609AD26|nr:PAS domain-containing protein [Ferrovibrio sp.]MCW0233085.1 PAS domain-containing protein [Ferrovibrio sp.]